MNRRLLSMYHPAIRRRLSSRRTVFMRWFPIVAPAGLMIVLIWFSWLGPALEYAPADSTPSRGKWTLTIFVLVSVLAFYWGRCQIKNVWLDGNELVVSCCGKVARISGADIGRVFETSWGPYTRAVQINLRQETPFGRKILFIPKWRWRWIWDVSEHPAITTIRALIPRDAKPFENHR